MISVGTAPGPLYTIGKGLVDTSCVTPEAIVCALLGAIHDELIASIENFQKKMKSKNKSVRRF